MSRPSPAPRADPTSAAPRADLAFRVQNASFAYSAGRDDLPAVRGVTLDVPRGKATVLMGPNGCGKTTLIRLLAGATRPTSGAIHRVNGAGGRGAVGYIPQQLGLVRARTARENVLMGALQRVPFLASATGLWPAAEERLADSLLARVGLASKAERKAHELSGGERQRVAIARALMQRPSVLVADEFVSNLDVVKAGEVLDLTRELRREGVTLVLALHSLDLALEYGDRIVFLRDGAIEAEYDAVQVTEEVGRRHLLA